MRDILAGISANEELPGAGDIGLARLVHRGTVVSTMDEAHALAGQGAPAGTLVVADEQTQGRGRSGRNWVSHRGSGLWMTLLERPESSAVLDVLSLRLGLAISQSLDDLVEPVQAPLRLKWPNDVHASNEGGKLAGILVEARWREQSLDWVAIGIGINMRAVPGNVSMAALKGGVTRSEVLRRLVPRLREAAATKGWLNGSELDEWHSRDAAIGRAIEQPVAGVVAGLSPQGELLVRTNAEEVQAVRSGSLVFVS